MSTLLRVLLVEDSEDDALLNLRELRAGGYKPEWARVETREDMAEALASKAWDLILADHNMPRFDAFGALAVMRERGLDLPFVLVTGTIGEEQVAAAMKEGAQDYVQKQALSRLVPAVRRALAAAHERQERRRTELALRQSEERYALAVRGSCDGIWDYDIGTGQTYYSDRLREMLGRAALGSTIESFAALLDADDRSRLEAALKDHLERRAPFEVEYQLRSDAGELRWFCTRGQALWDEEGRPVRMAGSLTDITARKEYAETLRQKLEIIERQQEAIRSLSTPIIEVWDGVLMMPVFGAALDQGAQPMMEVLLAAVARTRSRHAIIDLTSVEEIDARAADQIVRLIQAVGLIGAQGIVVGIRPEVARIMVETGADLQKVATMATLRDALLLCMSSPRAR